MDYINNNYGLRKFMVRVIILQYLNYYCSTFMHLFIRPILCTENETRCVCVCLSACLIQAVTQYKRTSFATVWSGTSFDIFLCFLKSSYRNKTSVFFNFILIISSHLHLSVRRVLFPYNFELMSTDKSTNEALYNSSSLSGIQKLKCWH
jgi:hypothetical protein